MNKLIQVQKMIWEKSLKLSLKFMI